MKIPNLIIVEPYRVFFPLGWLMGIVGVSYWSLVSTGLIVSYKPLYHGLIQIELFIFAFAVGFLLTALPKFLRTRSASIFELVSLIVVYILLASTTLSSAPLFISQWIFVLLVVLLIRFAIVRVIESKASPPFSFLLVGFGLFEGILGALLLIFPSSIFPLLGHKLLEQGMVLSLSLGVGTFLGPRLMGVVDTENAIVSLPGRVSNTTLRNSSSIVVVCTIGMLIFVSFLIETGWNREIGFYLRAVTAALCLARFSVLKIPRSKSITGILVATALWAMPLGLLLAGMLPHHEIGMLHLTYIGGFGLLIVTIGAQVITSHGGVHQFWLNHKKGAVLIATAIGFSTIVRMSATFFPNYYLFLIGISAWTFDVALLFWGIGVLRYLGSKMEKTQNA